jgi:hypothetical protein
MKATENYHLYILHGKKKHVPHEIPIFLSRVGFNHWAPERRSPNAPQARLPAARSIEKPRIRAIGAAFLRSDRWGIGIWC